MPQPNNLNEVHVHSHPTCYNGSGVYSHSLLYPYPFCISIPDPWQNVTIISTKNQSKLTFFEADDINPNKALEALSAYGALMMRGESQGVDTVTLNEKPSEWFCKYVRCHVLCGKVELPLNHLANPMNVDI